MNSVRKCGLSRNYSKCFIVFTVLLFSGCGSDNSHFAITDDQLIEFQNAGPAHPKVDIARLLRARTVTGPYRVVPDDLLELQIPLILQLVTAEIPDSLEMPKPYMCRVSYDGNINVPVVGQLYVIGKTLQEIETAIVNAYYPNYCVARPTIVARVVEYKTVKVCINGAVEKPGIYELRSDQMSLVSLIMASGGIVNEGSASIQIDRQEQSNLLAYHQEPPNKTEAMTLLENMGVGVAQEVSDVPDPVIAEIADNSILLPVEGLNVPFADVPIKEGDTVTVHQLGQPRFTVMGLVNKPGTFEYPPDARYSLMEALAWAGGLHIIADPQYATVYRQKNDGTVVSAHFKIGEDLTQTDAPTVLIKPGDIVAVEQTPKTRTNLWLDRVFRISTGIYTGANFAN